MCMSFDEAISTEIPLSRMLDALFDDSIPEEVVRFLRAWPDAFQAITNESAYVSRVFQLDFLAALSESDKLWLSDHMMHAGSASLFAYLFWQVKKHNWLSSSPISELLCFAEVLEFIRKHCLKHPYGGGHESYVTDLDAHFLQLEDIEAIAHAVSEFPDRVIFLNYSLFAQRMMQADFFTALSPAAKYMFLKDSMHRLRRQCLFDGKVLRDFIIQVLESHEDIAVKKMLLKEAKHSRWQPSFVQGKEHELLASCSCIEELLLRQAMLGTCGEQQSLVVHLLVHKPSWVKAWAKTDPDGLDKLLTISSFAKELCSK